MTSFSVNNNQSSKILLRKCLVIFKSIHCHLSMYECISVCMYPGGPRDSGTNIVPYRGSPDTLQQTCTTPIILMYNLMSNKTFD